MTLTFKDFILNEADYNKDSRAKTLKLSNEEIIKSIEQYSPKTIESFKHVRIYRGIKSIAIDSKYVDPTQFIRQSANTSNFYTTLIDNLPSWSKYPKRSKSLVCSTDHHYAHGYGSTYLVIPMDGVPIGICYAEDFWSAFPYVESNMSGESMGTFNTFIFGILDALDVVEGLETKSFNLKDSSDFGKLKKELNKLTASNIDKVFRTGYYIDDEFKKYIRKNIKSMSMIELLNKLLDPEKNKFDLIKSGQKFPSHVENNEVWVGGKSLLLPVKSTDSKVIFKHFNLLDLINEDIQK